MSLNIRPCKVLQAANWLRTNSSLYKDEGVIFDSDWINTYNYNVENDRCLWYKLRGWTTEWRQVTELLHDDEWSEGETEVPAGVTGTMLTAT